MCSTIFAATIVWALFAELSPYKYHCIDGGNTYVRYYYKWKEKKDGNVMWT